MRDLLKVFWAYFIRPFLWHNRKYIVILFLGIMLLSLASRYGIIRLPFSQSKGIEAMATNTALVLHTEDYQSILANLEQTTYAKDLMKISILEKWKNNLTLLDSLLEQTNEYAGLLKKASITSGAQVINSSEADWLFAVEMSDNVINIEELLAAMMPIKLTNNNYRGYTVYTLYYEKNKQFSFAYFNQLLLISTSTLLVETGVEQLDQINTSIAYTPSFERVLSYQPLSATDNLSVYVNLETLSLLTGVLTKGQSDAIERLEKIGSWMGMSSRFLREGFVLSGKFAPRAENKFLQALCKQKAPASSKIADYLPKKTAALLYLGWEDFEDLYDDYNNVDYPNFERYILPWIDREIALVIQDPIDQKNVFKNDKIVLLQAKDTLLARQALTEYGEKYGRFRKGTYQNFDVTELGLNHIIEPILGNDLDPIEDACYTIVDNYVVFANSTATLEDWIRQYVSGSILSQTAEYAAFVKQIKRQSNVYTFFSTPKSLKFLKYLVRAEWHDYITTQFKGLKNLYPIGIHCHGMQDYFVVNLSTSHLTIQPQNQNQSSVAWSYSLDTEAATLAYPLYDVAQNQYYTFVQDSSRRVYLLNNKGQNLWEEPIFLPELIQSEVFGIDYYNSDQLQFAFNTASSIYVLDKTGQTLKKIDLIAPAKAGLLVTNYKRTPSFFIPCRNGGVYGFDKNGRPLNGWQPNKNVGPVHFPMQYMEYKEEHYLVATSRAGTCKAFEHNGTAHFRGGILGLKLTEWGLDPSIGRIAAGNKDGTIRILNYKGRGFKINALPNINQQVSFAYVDVTGDERKDYVRLQDSVLAIHYYTTVEDKKGKQKDKFVAKGIFSLPHQAQAIFEVNMVNQAKKSVGMLDKQQGSIYLYDGNGVLHDGFPLAGTSPFSSIDLFNENRNAIVVINNNQIYAYKLN